jgi:hypothetical protein
VTRILNSKHSRSLLKQHFSQTSKEASLRGRYFETISWKKAKQNKISFARAGLKDFFCHREKVAERSKDLATD